MHFLIDKRSLLY